MAFLSARQSVLLCLAWLLPLPQTCASAAANETIVIWKVGSPHTGETPDSTIPLDLRLQAEKIGGAILIQAFPASGFAEVFFAAFEAHKEPDILSFDNYGILEGVSTKLGSFTGIASSKTVRNSLVEVAGSLKDLTHSQGGWQFLISTSKNYQLARRLALASPDCDVDSSAASALPTDLSSISSQISVAFLGQSDSLKAYEDRERLIAEGMRRNPVHVLETKACGYWGNDHLAFVATLSSFESAKNVGQLPVLLVLRRHDESWKLLVASTDPISNTTFLKQLPALSQKLSRPGNDEGEPQTAELLAPESGQFPNAAPGQKFGNFTWSSSPAQDVVGEIVEFAYQNDARLFLRLGSKAAADEQLSAGLLWTTRTLWAWRVWSIAETGSISLSQTRAFQN